MPFIIGKSIRIGSFTPVKFLKNALVYCSLINFDFVLLHTENFDKRIILPFLVLTTFGFLLSVFFSTL